MSLRANGSHECAPDGKFSEAIQRRACGLDCFRLRSSSFPLRASAGRSRPKCSAETRAQCGLRSSSRNPSSASLRLSAAAFCNLVAVLQLNFCSCFGTAHFDLRRTQHGVSFCSPGLGHFIVIGFSNPEAAVRQCLRHFAVRTS
jgi:hypothetical protein